jgi:biopolymer transport protein TolR
MASAGPSPSSGRKKSLDAEVNLVPFIDLLSMCICFLLMTAVWMEVGSVNVKQSLGTEAPADNKQLSELDLKYVNPTSLQLNLKHNGATKSFTVQAATNEARLKQLHDTIIGLAGTLSFNKAQDLKSQFSQNIASAHITTMSGVSYGELVSVMDVFRDAGIMNLGLTPVRQ